MDFSTEQLHTFKAVLEAGTLERAARELNITASAVSQRLKGLEKQVGSVLFIRSRPIQSTPSGDVLLRLARETELLSTEARRQLRMSQDESLSLPPSKVSIAVNSDSLASWFTPVLHGLARQDLVACEILRHDEAHSTELLRSGQVMGAVTTNSSPVQGCMSVPLGTMSYRAMASADFVGRWLPGVDPVGELAAAPMVSFDRSDGLQLSMRRRLAGNELHGAPMVHFVPDSRQYVAAVAASLGWGMIPEIQDPKDGSLLPICPEWESRVQLYWQRWKIPSRALDMLTDLVVEAAAYAGLGGPKNR